MPDTHGSTQDYHKIIKVDLPQVSYTQKITINHRYPLTSRSTLSEENKLFFLAPARSNFWHSFLNK